MDFSQQKIIKGGPLSAGEALQKIKNWCAYQERSQEEARRKLYEYGLAAEDTESIISHLITENFLNEERFAIAFAGGKFRIKHWGRVRIRMGLKKHRISDYCIAKALASIDPEDYQAGLRQLIDKKIQSLKTGDRRKRFYTVLNYALARGFEGDLIAEHLTQLQISS